ncbi:MAG: low molecular weight phosphotyrosine protein phosphatase [Oxalobacter sp.]|nr:low molecular weight phosphotyrosine protein phosphatase [Oxalobacter sp.]
MAMTWHIMVICLGNICRSPMAEGFLKARLPEAEVASAGLEWATQGWSADDCSVRAMAEHGIDISSHRAQRLTEALLEGVDVVLTMEQDQVGIVRRRFPGFKGEVRRLCEGSDVEDPYGYPFSFFREVCQQISEGVDVFCKALPDKVPGR